MTFLPAVLGAIELLLEASLPAADSPICRASVVGPRITISYELENGYRLKSDWRILGFAHASTPDGTAEISGDYVLDGLVESDSVTGRQALVRPIAQLRLQTTGSDAEQALSKLRDMWCSVALGGRATTLAFAVPARARP